MIDLRVIELSHNRTNLETHKYTALGLSVARLGSCARGRDVVRMRLVLLRASTRRANILIPKSQYLKRLDALELRE